MGLVTGSISLTRFKAPAHVDETTFESHPFKDIDLASEVKESIGFISFEPDERMLPYAIQHLGDDVLVFASDYPHFDGSFPDSVRTVVQRDDITSAGKRKLLGDNARRLYPRLG